MNKLEFQTGLCLLTWHLNSDIPKIFQDLFGIFETETKSNGRREECERDAGIN